MKNLRLTSDYILGLVDLSINTRRTFKTKTNKNTSETKIVIWGENLPSSIGLGIFTKQVSYIIKISGPVYQGSVIVGLILSVPLGLVINFCFKG